MFNFWHKDIRWLQHHLLKTFIFLITCYSYIALERVFTWTSLFNLQNHPVSKGGGAIHHLRNQQGNQGRECMFAQDGSNSKRLSWTWKGSRWPPVQASSRGGGEQDSLRQLIGLWEGDLPHAVQGSHKAGDTSWGQLAVGLTVTQSLNIDQGSPTC